MNQEYRLNLGDTTAAQAGELGEEYYTQNTKRTSGSVGITPALWAWGVFGLSTLYAVLNGRKVMERSLQSLPGDLAQAAESPEVTRIFLFGTTAGLLLSAVVYSLLVLSILRTISSWGRDGNLDPGMCTALYYAIAAAFVAPLSARLLPVDDEFIALSSGCLLVLVTCYLARKHVRGLTRPLILVLAVLAIQGLAFSSVYFPLSDLRLR